MSSEAPSTSPTGPTNTHNRDTSNKRIRTSFDTALTTGNPAQPKGSPLTVAAGKVDSYVKTLHTAMQDHLLDLLSATLQKGASYFWKNKKHNEMLQDPDYRPGSVKNITVPLNVVEEVRKSEDYITLSGQLQAETLRHAST